MSVRVTNEYIEVLGKTTGETRCTQIYIEVLCDEQVVYERSLSDPITFAQDAEDEIIPAGDLEVDASSTLALTDQADYVIEIEVSASNDLELEDLSAAYTQNVEVEASSVLDLEDEASSLLDHYRELSSDLGLTDQADRLIDYGRALSSSLGLTDEGIGARVHSESVSSVLSLSHIALRIKEGVAFDDMAFDESVITNMNIQAAFDLLTITQDITISLFDLFVSNSLLLEQTVYLAQTFNQDTSSVLALSQEALPGLYVMSAAHDLGLLQLEVYGDLNNDVNRPAANAMDLQQELTYTIDKAVSLPTEIEVLPGTKYLQLTDFVSYIGPKDGTASSTLALTDLVTLGSDITRSVTSLISFADKAGRVSIQNVSSAITFTQKAERRYYVSSVLSLSQTASGQIGRSASSLLSLTDLVALNVDYVRDIETELNLVQSLTYTLIGEGTLCRYSPFLGETSQVPVTAPVTTNGTLTLIFESTTLVLRNPNLGNTEQYNFHRVNRATRFGIINVMADPKWPKQKTLHIQIDALTEQQIQDLFAFVATSLGKLITLNDWEGRSWEGIITTPELAVTRGKACSHSVTFDFEGEEQ